MLPGSFRILGKTRLDKPAQVHGSGNPTHSNVKSGLAVVDAFRDDFFVDRPVSFRHYFSQLVVDSLLFPPDVRIPRIRRSHVLSVLGMHRLSIVQSRTTPNR